MPHLGQEEGSIEFDSAVCAPLGGTVAAGMVHEDLPHKAGRNGEKMRTVVSIKGPLVQQPQVRLVNQGCALQGMSWTFPLQMMPRDIALRVYMDHEKFYDKLQQRSATRRTRMDATAVLVSGCQDNQTSADGDRNGLFTETLLAVWKNGKFNGDYPGFHKSIVKLMPPTQSPNYFTMGRTNEQFENQKPFTV